MKQIPVVYVTLLLLGLTITTASAASTREIEQWDRGVIAAGVEYMPYLSPPRFVVPSEGLPQKIRSLIMPSNNCVGIKLFNNTLFMGWR